MSDIADKLRKVRALVELARTQTGTSTLHYSTLSEALAEFPDPDAVGEFMAEAKIAVDQAAAICRSSSALAGKVWKLNTSSFEMLKKHKSCSEDIGDTWGTVKKVRAALAKLEEK